jgi:hypothetical protein
MKKAKENTLHANILHADDTNDNSIGSTLKIVMRDERLSITAKAIYGYFYSYAGAGERAFPNVSQLVDELGICRSAYYKHFNLLKDCGYISVWQEHRHGRLSYNIYTLMPVALAVARTHAEIQDAVPQEIDSPKPEIPAEASPLAESSTHTWDAVSPHTVTRHARGNNIIIIPENKPFLENDILENENLENDTLKSDDLENNNAENNTLENDIPEREYSSPSSRSCQSCPFSPSRTSFPASPSFPPRPDKPRRRDINPNARSNANANKNTNINTNINASTNTNTDTGINANIFPRIDANINPYTNADICARSHANTTENASPQMTFEECREKIKAQIDYDLFEQLTPQHIPLAKDIVSIIADVYLSDSTHIRVDGENKPRTFVRQVFEGIGYTEVRHVIRRYENLSGHIRKKRQYITTMLFNARLEYDAHLVNTIPLLDPETLDIVATAS